MRGAVRFHGARTGARGGRRTAGVTVHGTFRPVKTLNIVNERAEGLKVARATRSLKHVLSRVGYVVRVLAVSTDKT